MAASARSARRLTRDASAKSTIARAISAAVRIVDECRSRCTRAVGPCVTTRPRTTKPIGAEMSQRSSRRETRPHTTMQADVTASAARLRSRPMSSIPS